MLQGGQVQGQVQTTQAQWRQQQLEMHKQKQQQIIHQHVQTLTIEQRQQFAAMSAMEKQQYLAQRNLLLPNPSANWGQQVQLQRHTIQVSYFPLPQIREISYRIVAKSYQILYSCPSLMTYDLDLVTSVVLFIKHLFPVD